MNKFVLFKSHEQFFAVSIAIIEKIILFQPPTLIPDTSAYIFGYLPYDGKPLALIDMRMRLFQVAGVPDEETKIIVIHWKGKKVGLVVDEVVRVQDFQADSNRETHSEDEKTNYIVEIFQEKDEIILHLDIDKLFSEEGVEEIEAIIEK